MGATCCVSRQPENSDTLRSSGDSDYFSSTSSCDRRPSRPDDHLRHRGLHHTHQESTGPEETVHPQSIVALEPQRSNPLVVQHDEDSLIIEMKADGSSDGAAPATSQVASNILSEVRRQAQLQLAAQMQCMPSAPRKRLSSAGPSNEGMNSNGHDSPERDEDEPHDDALNNNDNDSDGEFSLASADSALHWKRTHSSSMLRTSTGASTEPLLAGPLIKFGKGRNAGGGRVSVSPQTTQSAAVPADNVKLLPETTASTSMHVLDEVPNVSILGRSFDAADTQFSPPQDDGLEGDGHVVRRNSFDQYIQEHLQMQILSRQHLWFRGVAELDLASRSRRTSSTDDSKESRLKPSFQEVVEYEHEECEGGEAIPVVLNEERTREVSDDRESGRVSESCEQSLDSVHGSVTSASTKHHVASLIDATVHHRRQLAKRSKISSSNLDFVI